MKYHLRLPTIFLFPKYVGDIDFSKTPKVRFFVGDIISEGLSFLTAFSKVGKSKLITQMLLAICNGSQFLGKNTTRSDVLYCALKDEEIDFENRMNSFLNGKPQPKNFYFFTKEAFNYSTPRLRDDGTLIAILESFLQLHPTVKVIAIDVFGVI